MLNSFNRSDSSLGFAQKQLSVLFMRTLAHTKWEPSWALPWGLVAAVLAVDILTRYPPKHFLIGKLITAVSLVNILVLTDFVPLSKKVSVGLQAGVAKTERSSRL